MSCGRLFPTLVALVLVSAPLYAEADSGSGSGSAVVVAGSGSGSGSDTPVASPTPPAPAPTPAPQADVPDPGTTVQAIAKAIHTKDWFLLAGALLAGLIHLTRYLLAKKWPRWNESHYGVAISIAMAGVASLAVAWTSGGDVASSHTLLGALKLLVAATTTYVVPKAIAQGLANTNTASSSNTPPPS